MKNLLLLVFTFFIVTFTFAQDETLLKSSSNIQLGGFGGPIFQLSSINGDVAFFSGGGGGLMMNDFFVGAFGMGGTLDNTTIDTDNYAIDLGFGGLWLGYSLFDSKVIHPYAALKLGVGNVELYENEASEIPFFDETVWLIEPEVGVEVNIVQWFKIAGTIGYRAVNGLDTGLLLENNDLSALSFGLSFRFGFFPN